MDNAHSCSLAESYLRRADYVKQQAREKQASERKCVIALLGAMSAEWRRVRYREAMRGLDLIVSSIQANVNCQVADLRRKAAECTLKVK